MLLRAIISALCIHTYESLYTLDQYSYKQYRKTYFIYVHDILILFKSAHRRTEVMVKSINKNNKNDQFTLKTRHVKNHLCLPGNDK